MEKEPESIAVMKPEYAASEYSSASEPPPVSFSYYYYYCY